MKKTTTMDMEVGFIFIYFTLNTEPSLKGMSDRCSDYK